MSTYGVLSRVAVQLPTDPPRGTSPEYLRHQAVMSLFMSNPDARPLFRVMKETAGLENLLVLGATQPVQTSSIETGVWVQRLESKPYAPALHTGQLLDFSIAVNATGIVTQPDGRKLRQDIWDIVFAGKPGAEVDRNHIYEQWLARQLVGGADVLEARIAARALVRVRRKPRAPSISFVRTELSGSLSVDDPALLLQSIVCGIGRARAFGCGLLCLMPHGSLSRR